MTTGQTLNNLEIILDRLLDRISEASIQLSAKAGIPKPTDMGYQDFWDKIAGYQNELAGIVRQLATIETNLDFRGRIARKLPREHRYRANQSVRSHGSHLQRVYEKAVRVEEALRDFCGQSLTPTKGDILSGLEKLSKQLQKSLSKSDYKAITEQLAQGRSQTGSLTGDSPIVQGTPLSLLVTLIVLWIGLRSKRDGDDNKKS